MFLEKDDRAVCFILNRKGLQSIYNRLHLLLLLFGWQFQAGRFRRRAESAS